MNQSVSTEQEPIWIGGFNFKSETFDGDKAKYRINIYNTHLTIWLDILSKNDFSFLGFKMEKKGPTLIIWRKHLRIRHGSFNSIMQGLNMVIKKNPSAQLIV